jgi:hypothetical protein
MRLFIVLLVLLFALLSEGEWSTQNGVEIYGEQYSVQFSSSKSQYQCPSVKCLPTFPAGFPMHTHFTVGTNHPSFYPLTILRLCDLFQQCIDRQKLLVTLHTNSLHESKRSLNKFIRLFQDLHVPYQVWFPPAIP